MERDNRDATSYKQIFKSTSIFGGVQVIGILISIVRSKIISVLLGPTGMGFAGLLLSNTGIISSLTNFGIGTSAIKNIAEANGEGDEIKISQNIKIVRRLSWLTGLLGVVVTLLTSSYLSELTFGDKTKTFAFVWISISLLFNQLFTGEIVLLQGLRKVKQLAAANLWGSFLGLLISIPLYYFYKIDGVVPAIIISAFASYIIALFFTKKIPLSPTSLDKKKFILESKNILKMGFMLSIASLFTILTLHIIRLYIGHKGGVHEVGLYNAGTTIIVSYVGVIFTAMSTDYYPRLTAMMNSKEGYFNLVSQQIDVALLILTPILVIFILFIDFFIRLLYSAEFLAITEMMQWYALGTLFKAFSWALGFIILAKGDSKSFLINETIANVYIFAFNIIGYALFGLKGIGIAFVVSYAVYLLQMLYVSKYKYGLKLGTSVFKIFAVQLFFAVLSFLIYKFTLGYLFVFLSAGIVAIVVYLSFKSLNSKMQFTSMFKKNKQ